MSKITCQECGLPMYVDPNAGYMETCVGYFSPPGHNHDDNCRSTVAVCDNGHRKGVSIRRRCHHPTCNWKGKEECFCHEGKKLNDWPIKPTSE